MAVRGWREEECGVIKNVEFQFCKVNISRDHNVNIHDTAELHT